MPGKPGWCVVNRGGVPKNYNTVALQMDIMWVKGKPEKSGNYRVRYHGNEGRDDYTTSGGGHWWNTASSNDQEQVEYDPESFREL